MGRVLMDSLEYLPEEAEFGDFRAAFMYSTGKFLGNDKMKKVGKRLCRYERHSLFA